ncbi:MAG: pyridoxal phosphate-dependent aminotransferase, partial [Dolichospermum sp.]
MNYELSRMKGIQSPIIPVIGELIKNSPGTISLGQGVVHYQPPETAMSLLPNFLAEPKNHLYQAVVGVPELLTALAAKLSIFNGIDINEK